jgi:hypothetical protein
LAKIHDIQERLLKLSIEISFRKIWWKIWQIIQLYTVLRNIKVLELVDHMVDLLALPCIKRVLFRFCNESVNVYLFISIIQWLLYLCLLIYMSHLFASNENRMNCSMVCLLLVLLYVYVSFIIVYIVQVMKQLFNIRI